MHMVHGLKYNIGTSGLTFLHKIYIGTLPKHKSIPRQKFEVFQWNLA